MSRTVTMTIYKGDGTPWYPGAVYDDLLDVVTVGGVVYTPGRHEITLGSDGSPATAPEFITPSTGTVGHLVTLTDGRHYQLNVGDGATVDLSELIAAAGAAVDPDDLQTILDAAQAYTVTTVTTNHTVTASDRLILASGAIEITFPLSAQVKIPVVVFNKSLTQTITVYPTGGDTINSAASWTIYPLQAYAFIDAVLGNWEAM